jgi:hypothetical protein
MVAAVLVLAGGTAGCTSGDDDSGGGRAGAGSGGRSAGSCAFDTEAWLALDPDDDADGAQRDDMATMLMDCGTLDGVTRDRVADLLGPGGSPDADRWEYVVARGAFSPDYELLVVTFGADGRVASVSWGQS